MQSSSEQPLVGEEHCVTTLITAAKEINNYRDIFMTIHEPLQRKSRVPDSKHPKI